MTETTPPSLTRLTRRLMAGVAAFFALVGSAMAETVSLEVAQATAAKDHNGFPALNVRLSDAGRKALGDFTTRNVGTTVEVMLGDKVLTAPYVMSPITGGQMMITGNFTLEEIEQMVARIEAEAQALIVRLPTP